MTDIWPNLDQYIDGDFSKTIFGNKLDIYNFID
jgi:hypothetical protein